MTRTIEKSSPRIDARVARLESWTETFTERIQGVETAVHEQGKVLGESLNRLGQDMQRQIAELARARLPNWGLIISALGLLLMVIGSIGGMAMVPLYLMSQNTADGLRTVTAWQDDYLRGRIPSAAAGQIMQVQSALDLKLAEVETQFRCAKEETQKTAAQVDENRKALGQVAQDIARLQEREGTRGPR